MVEIQGGDAKTEVQEESTTKTRKCRGSRAMVEK